MRSRKAATSAHGSGSCRNSYRPATVRSSAAYRSAATVSLFNKETAIMTNLETYEFSPEMETYETEWGGEAEVFSEAEAMELAGELLEITTWAELDRLLGGLIDKGGTAVGAFGRSPIGHTVGVSLEGDGK